MDAQRELLNQLMGKDRDLPSDQQRRRRFSDRDVCKHYLCGLCPYELFSNTKSDLGPHPYGEEDDDDMRREFEKLDEAERRRYGYDRNLLVLLEDMVSGCDRKVERNRERVLREEKETLPDDEEIDAVLGLDRQIEDFVGSAEALAAEDDAEAAFEMLREARKVCAEREKKVIGNEVSQKRTIVCETCGNFMSTTDGVDRLRCHFAGRQYQGWKLCREKLKELREKVGRGGGTGMGMGMDRRDDPPRERSRDRYDRRDSYGDRDRDRGSRYDRDRDDWRRGGGRDRDRDYRDRDRGGWGGGGGGGGRRDRRRW